MTETLESLRAEWERSVYRESNDLYGLHSFIERLFAALEAAENKIKWLRAGQARW